MTIGALVGEEQCARSPRTLYAIAPTVPTGRRRGSDRGRAGDLEDRPGGAPQAAPEDLRADRCRRDRPFAGAAHAPGGGDQPVRPPPLPGHTESGDRLRRGEAGIKAPFLGLFNEDTSPRPPRTRRSSATLLKQTNRNSKMVDLPRRRPQLLRGLLGLWLEKAERAAANRVEALHRPLREATSPEAVRRSATCPSQPDRSTFTAAGHRAAWGLDALSPGHGGWPRPHDHGALAGRRRGRAGHRTTRASPLSTPGSGTTPLSSSFNVPDGVRFEGRLPCGTLESKSPQGRATVAHDHGDEHRRLLRDAPGPRRRAARPKAGDLMHRGAGARVQRARPVSIPRSWGSSMNFGGRFQARRFNKFP